MAEERDRRRAEAPERNRHEGRRRLLSGRREGVELARVRTLGDRSAEREEAVRLPGHGRDDDHEPIPGFPRPEHAVRDGPDPLHAADGRAAELLDHEGHGAAEGSQGRPGFPAAAQVVPLAFANLLRTLRQPIDSRLIKTREGWTDRQGNTHWVEYIEWHTAADILDRVAPDWSHAVRNITQIGDMVAVTASITIDGVTREGVGTGPADTETGIKKAEHDALKRAAVKFGIARELYRRESDVVEESPTTAASLPVSPSNSSMATSTSRC